MKRFLICSMLVGAAVAASSAMASDGSLNGFKPKVLPVLVRADADGKVTAVEPSRQLPPKFQRLLEQSIDSWIAEPAKIKGKPVDSYVVINVALRAAEQADGKYEAGFDYVSSNPVAWRGPLHWQTDGVRVALVDEFDRQRMDMDRMWQRQEHRMPQRPDIDRPQLPQPPSDAGERMVVSTDPGKH